MPMSEVRQNGTDNMCMGVGDHLLVAKFRLG